MASVWLITTGSDWQGFSRHSLYGAERLSPLKTKGYKHTAAQKNLPSYEGRTWSNSDRIKRYQQNNYMKPAIFEFLTSNLMYNLSIWIKIVWKGSIFPFHTALFDHAIVYNKTVKHNLLLAEHWKFNSLYKVNDIKKHKMEPKQSNLGFFQHYLIWLTAVQYSPIIDIFITSMILLYANFLWTTYAIGSYMLEYSIICYKPSCQHH